MTQTKRGSLTIEAAIVLPVILAVIFTMGFLIQIFYVHTVVQFGLNETAKEMATYGYILQKGGLYSYHSGLVEGGQTEWNELSSAIQDPFVMSGELFESFTLANIKNLFEEIEKSISTIENYTDDPAKLAKALVLYALQEQYQNNIVNPLGEGLARAMMKKYIAPNESVEARLRRLSIVDGHLDFTGSQFFARERPDYIKIQVTYELKPVLPIPLIGSLKMTQAVTVRAWVER